MSTPVPATPKGPRNAKRIPKRMTTPRSNTNVNNPSSFVGKTTPPSRSPPTPSNDTNTTYDSANASEGGLRKKKGRPTKPARDQSKSSATNGVGNVNGGHRHSSSQTSVKSPMAIRDSPHYAGPTFHASPAPSALPVPSFVSKSVPESDSPLQTRVVDDLLDTEAGHSTPTKAKTVPLLQEDEHASSPLDFLFRAAREARLANGANDKNNRPGLHTSYSQSNFQRMEGNQETETVSGAVFPLELDVSESRTRTPDKKMMAIGPSFAPSYKERMDALRSVSLPSSPGDIAALNDEERKAKAEALKNILMNPSQPRLASPSLGPRSGSNLFSPRSKDVPANNRYVSNPATGSTASLPNERHLPAANNNTAQGNSIPHQYLASICNEAQSFPSPSPGGRKQMTSATYVNHSPQPTRAHSFRSPLSRSEFQGNHVSPSPNRTVSPLASATRPIQGISTRLDPLETKRMEDDLRRILKLSASDAHNPNGIEQTMA